jgi:hypothetical protein
MRITLEGDDRQTLIARLGLSSDASDADITAAVATRILAESEAQPPADPPAAPAATPSGPQTTDPPAASEEEDDEDLDDADTVHVDAAAYRALTARAERSAQIEEEARVATRDRLIEDAIKAGKFPPARRNHYRERYDSDAEATAKQIGRMAKNVVPVAERGKDVSDEDLEAKSDAYDPTWVPEVAQRAAAANGAAGGGRPSRIHTED